MKCLIMSVVYFILYVFWYVLNFDNRHAVVTLKGKHRDLKS